MKLVLGILLFFIPAFSAMKSSPRFIVNNEPISEKLSLCLRLALKGENPNDRDQKKIKCIEDYKTLLSVETCAKLAQEMEYSTSEDQTKTYCLNDLPSTIKMNFAQCFQIAHSMEYIDNSEGEKWDCFRKFEGKITKNECLNAAQKMKFLSNRTRLKSFCSEEVPLRK